PLLMADDHHRLPIEMCRAADDGGVVGIHSIAVQLLEVREDRADIIERVRALRMARELRDLPLRQLRENAHRERAALCTQTGDLFPDVHLRIAGDELQLIDLRLELCNRLLEIEEIPWHRHTGSCS